MVQRKKAEYDEATHKNTGYEIMFVPHSRAKTVIVMKKRILHSDSSSKNTLKQFISIISMRALGFNYSFKPISKTLRRITNNSKIHF